MGIHSNVKMEEVGDKLTTRKIIKIDEEKCTGCGDCIPNCPEGALQIIDGKVRLISDLFCDGLGACIGHCPEDAIEIEEREAEPYEERRVMENIIKAGPNTMIAHLLHLKEHGEEEFLSEAIEYLEEQGIEPPAEVVGGGECNETPQTPHQCPGSAVLDLSHDRPSTESGPSPRQATELRQWPVQTMLVPPNAPYLRNADLLITADCVPFAYPNFHTDILKGKVLLVGCPKLDDAEFYQRKFAAIMEHNDLRSITVAHMEVPCCFGLGQVVKAAMADAGVNVPIKDITIGVKGEKVCES